MRSSTVRALTPFRGVVAGLGCYWAEFAQVRYQSSSPDKRFHCSVCKKSFRLEKAAQLHLQQAHNNDGNIEIGAGPGCESNAQPSRSNSLPSGPTVISEPLESSTQGERSRPRRSRPIPKPLNTPEKEVPPDVIEEILDVWDSVGVQRLGGKFIHSSMIMKVSATKPEEKLAILYDYAGPKGDTLPVKFEFQTDKTVKDSVYHIDLDDAYSMAPAEPVGPFNAALCDNPLTEAGSGFLEAFKATPKPADPMVATPVATFGQLPMFGQHQQPSAVGSTLNGSQPCAFSLSVASPFANAAAIESPFSGTLASFSASVAALPCASPALSSPFLAGQAAAPSAAPAAAGPFATPPVGDVAASPFAANGALPFAPMATLPDFVGAGRGGPGAETAPKHKCDSCGRDFSTHEGLRMHAQVKHGVKLPRSEINERNKKKKISEFSAYIPSPVDLSMTSPFGVQDQSESSWIETEIIPHAVAVSNITITGKVLEVKKISDKILQIRVFVSAEAPDESDTMTIMCWKELSKLHVNNIQCDDHLFVCGLLRLTPVYENLNDKHYSTPVVHVALPAGYIAKIG